jgi:hypothetical protein
MNVQVITTSDELRALAAGWNELATSPLHSWDWLATWWSHYGGAERQLHVLAVYDDGRVGEGLERRLVGIAPWYLEQRTSLAWLWRSLHRSPLADLSA